MYKRNGGPAGIMLSGCLLTFTFNTTYLVNSKFFFVFELTKLQNIDKITEFINQCCIDYNQSSDYYVKINYQRSFISTE